MRPTLTAVCLALLASAALFGADASAAAAEPCPNEAIREAQGSTALPDCRAYEQVSPVDNQNADIFVPLTEGNDSASDGTRLPFQAGADGNEVTYVGEATDTGSGGENQYLATRSADGGWTQVDTQPTITNSTSYQAFSSDLSLGVLSSKVQVGGLPLLGEGELGLGYDLLYSRATGDGTYHPFFSTPPSHRSIEEFGTANVENQSALNLTYAGSSADLKRLLFEANDALTSNALDGGPQQNNLYESVEGELQLINVLPDGTTETNASFGSVAPDSSDPPDFSHVISEDGTRVFWTDLNTGRVYVRENSNATAPVSAGAARFWTATPDGRYAFYSEAGALYRFDLESETREELAGPGAAVQGLIGSSGDGQYVYFVADGALAGGATAGDCNLGEQKSVLGCNLYLRHDGEITFIASLSYEDINEYHFGEHYGDLQPGLAFRTAEVTPGGHSAVFMSHRSLTGYRANGSHGPMSEVFVYSADSDTLFCASCDPNGEPPLFTDSPQAAFLPHSHSDTYLPRWISNDGARVFFDSNEPLVGQDTNGRQDVYEWERDGAGSCRLDVGCVYLLSTGTSTDVSSLIDASLSGDDVFIVTRSRLVAGNQDDRLNLFDVRVEGGRPPPALCSGASCLNGLPAAPSFPTPLSATPTGIGNPTPKPLTPAKRLAIALRACRAKHNRRRRAACETRVEKEYGPRSKTGNATAGKGGGR